MAKDVQPLYTYIDHTRQPVTFVFFFFLVVVVVVVTSERAGPDNLHLFASLSSTDVLYVCSRPESPLYTLQY